MQNIKEYIGKLQIKSIVFGIIAGVFLSLAIFSALVPYGGDMIRVYNMQKFSNMSKNRDTSMNMANHTNPYMMSEIKSEKQFLQDMKLHHESAILMSQQLLKLNPRVELKKLANDIISAQNTEIKMMTDWLNLWK